MGKDFNLSMLAFLYYDLLIHLHTKEGNSSNKWQQYVHLMYTQISSILPHV